MENWSPTITNFKSPIFHQIVSNHQNSLYNSVAIAGLKCLSSLNYRLEWTARLKKCKIGKGNLYLTKDRFGKNETCCAEDNHSSSCASHGDVSSISCENKFPKTRTLKIANLKKSLIIS